MKGRPTSGADFAAMLPGFEDREIAAEAIDRTPLPSNVFCYPLVESWRDRVWRMLDDVIPEDVRSSFADNPPEYVVSDDLSWLDDLILDITGQDTNIKELTAERMSREFRAFRAAHGTRTNDLASFYRQGLRVLRAEEIEDRARSIFLNGQAQYATEERLEEAIRAIGARDRSRGREGVLYFCACEDELFRDYGAGHYLTYGSEYLYCLGIRVMNTWETKRALKELGRPTLFVCDIPMDLIGSGTLREFSGMILEYMFCELVEGLDAHALSPGSGSALSLRCDLPATCIVGHYHPTTIHDPLRYA